MAAAIQQQEGGEHIMVKKILALALLLSFFGASLIATDAQAKRRCSPGTDDNGTNVCVPK